MSVINKDELEFAAAVIGVAGSSLTALRADLEFAAKAIGVAGPSLTALRAVFVYLQRHSLERRRVETMQDIDLGLKRIDRISTQNDRFNAGKSLSEYIKALREDLATNEMKLAEIRNKKAHLELKKKEDPQGIRKWLSFYRPEGIDGWISQTMFYIFALTGFFVATRGAILVAHKEWWAAAWIAGSSVYFGIAFYFWSVSLRLRRIGNAQRRGELGKLNPDLGWFKRIFLIVSGEKRRRAVYYLCLVEIIFSPWVTRHDFTSDKVLTYFFVLFFGMTAEVLRADALSHTGMRNASFSFRK